MLHCSLSGYNTPMSHCLSSQTSQLSCFPPGDCCWRREQCSPGSQECFRCDCSCSCSSCSCSSFSCCFVPVFAHVPALAPTSPSYQQSFHRQYLEMEQRCNWDICRWHWDHTILCDIPPDPEHDLPREELHHHLPRPYGLTGWTSKDIVQGLGSASHTSNMYFGLNICQKPISEVFLNIFKIFGHIRAEINISLHNS